MQAGQSLALHLALSFAFCKPLLIPEQWRAHAK